MKTTKRSLRNSVTALLLCFIMLVGTTFAWFTDEVTSANNIIKAGTLDLGMQWSTDNSSWKDAEGALAEPVFDYDKWEPGYTEVRYIKVTNDGSLAFKYQMYFNPTGVVGKLAEVIDVSYDIVTGNDSFTAPASKYDMGSLTTVGTLNELIASNEAVAGGVLLPNGETAAGYYTGEIVVCIAFHMQESAGNEYQGESIGDAFGINLYATQFDYENDSFDSSYDQNAAADFFPGFQGGSGGISVSLDDQRYTTEEVTVDLGDISVVIPAGVKLAEGFTSLTASVAVKNTSESNVHLNDNEQMRPSDVHIEGVADDNAIAMLITLKHYLPTGLNSGALTLYHMENGVAVPMTHAATPTNHNEFTYDPLTGDVTLALASFSEVAVIADTNNPWDGKTETAYVGSGTENDPYLIANADQLAYFRTQVDNGKSFKGEFVKLNNNIYLSNQLFDPIGWGYVNSGWNRDGVEGKVFQGTFDGNNKTIFDLYQSGWDLEETNGTDYTYTNCGFGLFAAASGATFKDLTINGAYVRVECVEAGVLVGLSQNTCIYENIDIHNAKIANYQRPAGGLIGEVSGNGTTTITNVTIGSDVVVGSLWGDFDAPCGGVIGARWDDVGADPKIVMTNVEVGARMDVYSDVTSAYQWYAYRRAGMLIGNTEISDPNNKHLAAAPFLTCENVKVYYGDWAAYHYCQFTNQDDSWCNNYPWVRVEAGENCSAYSNPRYGVPVINGVKVSDMDATTLEANRSGYEELRFNQLYGGGQGVYGQAVHDGVEVINYQYSITYVNDSQVLTIRYITENEAKNDVATAYGPAYDLVVKWAKENIGTENTDFVFDNKWMNAGSTMVDSIDAGNTKNIVLYPHFNKPYTAIFVDQLGNVVAWCLFYSGNLNDLETTRGDAEAALPNPGEGFSFDYWEVHITDAEGNTTSKTTYDEYDFAKSTTDVTIYPVYKYEGDVKLIPVDSDGDGAINYYQVAGYSNPNGQALVEIPGSVNGIPVTEVSGGAFSSYDGVHSIYIPAEVTYIGDNAFAEKWGLFDAGETITIYYGGSYDDWVAKEPNFGNDWESGISSDTRIFFLNGGDTVDVSQGYLQAKVSNSRNVTWTLSNVTSDIVNEYTGRCDCEISTTGDNAHIYVDSNGNIMSHNAEGTPVNSNGVIIEYKRKNIFSSYKLTTDHNDTYYRYRPDAEYWTTN